MAAATPTSASSNPYIDPSLAHFTSPTFSPAAFLNATLPPLHRNTAIQTDSAAVALIPLATQVQSLISQLSAQNARLSSTLTTLTDEIIRGGSRLAYEVEVLRGEALGLEETLREKLEEDVKKFVPGGIANIGTGKLEGDMQKLSLEEKEGEGKELGEDATANDKTDESKESAASTADLDPEYLRQLRTLIAVRSRLESVIKIFGDAMAWPLPPPENIATITDSFITISTPVESGREGITEEERKKSEEYIQNLRTEITDILSQKHVAPQKQQQQSETERTEVGIKAAQARVDELRQLVSVFAGTAEEAPRLRVVEELQELVDERKVQLEEKIARQNQGSSGSRGMLSGWRRSQDGNRRSSSMERRGTPQKEESVGTGLLRNLARLRDEIYLE